MSALRTFFAAGLMAGSAAAVLVACSSFGSAPTEPVSDGSVTDGAVSPVGDAIAVPPDAGLVDQSAPIDAGPADASVDANDGGPVVFTCLGWSVTDGTFMADTSGACVLCKNGSSTNEALATLEIPTTAGRFELLANVSSSGPVATDAAARVGLVTQVGNFVPAERSINGPIMSMSTSRGAEITVDTGGRLAARLGVSGTGVVCAKFEKITLTRK